jgi:hypothetical protein
VTPREHNVEPIAAESRLNRLVQRTRLNANLARQLSDFSRETDSPLPTRATAAGDPAKLRGVPCVGRGLSGVVRGTRPDTRIFMEGAAFDLAVLVRENGNGVSPGTDPVEALLEAEAETERRLRERGRLDRGTG